MHFQERARYKKKKKDKEMQNTYNASGIPKPSPALGVPRDTGTAVEKFVELDDSPHLIPSLRHDNWFSMVDCTQSPRVDATTIDSGVQDKEGCTTWRKTSSVASDHMGGRSRRCSIDEVRTKEDCARVYWTDPESYASQDVLWAGNDMKDLHARKSDPMIKRPPKVNVAVRGAADESRPLSGAASESRPLSRPIDPLRRPLTRPIDPFRPRKLSGWYWSAAKDRLRSTEPERERAKPPALRTQAKSTASLEHTVLLSTMEHHSLQTPLILALLAEQRATASSQMRPKTLIGRRETPVG
ncbi:hypothetical protein C8R45DRAFT_930174 [Mycena sanguinolenta]|nr:hypothetical protein C8R45DRAFT_930174 [Mycena sanguinolenta]